MSWSDWAQRYVEEMAHRKRPRTLMGFRRQLDRFLAAMPVEQPVHLKAHHLSDYLCLLLDSGCKPSTAWGYLSRLRPFFRWLVRQEVMLWDPAAEMEIPSFPRNPKRVLSQTDVLKLLNSPSPNSWAGQRNRALLEFFYGTGLRLGEIQSLELSDLHLEDRLVRVRQSKTKPRWAVMGDHLTAVMRDYQERIRPLAQKDAMEAGLWINDAGQRLSYSGICGLIKKLGRRAGLRLSPHALRHAYATHLLQGGAPLRWIQALLGHQTLLATQIYTQLAPSDLLAEFRRTHPRARRKRTRERSNRATPGPAPGPRPAAGYAEDLAPLPAEL